MSQTIDSYHRMLNLAFADLVVSYLRSLEKVMP